MSEVALFGRLAHRGAGRGGAWRGLARVGAGWWWRVGRVGARRAGEGSASDEPDEADRNPTATDVP